MSSFAKEEKSDYEWTVMIRQPEAMTAELLEEAAAEVAEKKELPTRASSGWNFSPTPRRRLATEPDEPNR